MKLRLLSTTICQPPVWAFLLTQRDLILYLWAQLDDTKDTFITAVYGIRICVSDIRAAIGGRSTTRPMEDVFVPDDVLLLCDYIQACAPDKEVLPARWSETHRQEEDYLRIIRNKGTVCFAGITHTLRQFGALTESGYFVYPTKKVQWDHAPKGVVVHIISSEEVDFVRRWLSAIDNGDRCTDTQAFLIKELRKPAYNWLIP